MRRFLLAALLLAIGAPNVSAQTLTVVNDTGVSAAQVLRVERAVQYQFNHQVRRYWYRLPKVRFGPGGWRVILVTGRKMTREHYDGIHTTTADATPYALVATDFQPWSLIFSHEVIEMMADPYTSRTINKTVAELCDTVPPEHYYVRGVMVADFVTPYFYWAAPMAGLRHHKPFDWMHTL